MVWRFEEGRVDRGVFFVRSVVSAGKVEGMGMRDGRFGRWVELRSRLFSEGKWIGLEDGEVRSLRGLSRRERVVSLGSAVRVAMSFSDVMLLEERLSVVRIFESMGLVTLVRPLADIESVLKDGKIVVSEAMLSQQSRVLSKAKSSIPGKWFIGPPGMRQSVARNLFPLYRLGSGSAIQIQGTNLEASDLLELQRS